MGWAFEKESIPQVWDDLESFLTSYDANKIGAIIVNQYTSALV